MGAKTPTKLKLRRPTYKCDECGKKFLSVQAMKSHQYCSHKIKLTQTRSRGKLVNLLGKPVRRPGRAPQASRVAGQNQTALSSDRKIEYECPQCRQKFAVYFSALRHIQQYHCVNKKGEKVPSNSPHLIKPARVEMCIKCQVRVRPADQHSCHNIKSAMASGIDSTCICLGCNQTFATALMFDLHVSGLHSDGVETLFFTNFKEFTEWKEQMEAQSGASYLVLGKNPSRQTYRCTHAPRGGDGPAPRCPSTIVLKDYSKSIQVHFFKQHYGHTCSYKLPDRFKKFHSSEVMKKTLTGSTSEPEEEEDHYMNLKMLLDSVALAASKADTDTLKLLYNKAVEMEKILKPHEEVKPANKNMTDEQITDTLETLNKRKCIDDPLDLLRIKDEPLQSQENSRKKPKTVKEVKEPAKSTGSPIACFNDSYKEFVGKIQEKQVSVVKTVVGPKSVKKKKIMKTKIGQFKPSLSPKKEVVREPSVEKDLEYDNVTITNISFVKVKTEIDYEVIEQEDDCNILILKI